jgi:hypothetical protein
LKTIKNPVIARDLPIIANYRLQAGKEVGRFPPWAMSADVKPFRFPPRGYVVSGDKFIMLFNPACVDIELCLPSLHDVALPIEIFILKNHKVIDYQIYDL